MNKLANIKVVNNFLIEAKHLLSMNNLIIVMVQKQLQKCKSNIFVTLRCSSFGKRNAVFSRWKKSNASMIKGENDR